MPSRYPAPKFSTELDAAAIEARRLAGSPLAGTGIVDPLGSIGADLDHLFDKSYGDNAERGVAHMHIRKAIVDRDNLLTALEALVSRSPWTYDYEKGRDHCRYCEARVVQYAEDVKHRAGCEFDAARLAIAKARGAS